MEVFYIFNYFPLIYLYFIDRGNSAVFGWIHCTQAKDSVLHKTEANGRRIFRGEAAIEVADQLLSFSDYDYFCGFGEVPDLQLWDVGEEGDEIALPPRIRQVPEFPGFVADWGAFHPLPPELYTSQSFARSAYLARSPLWVRVLRAGEPEIIQMSPEQWAPLMSHYHPALGGWTEFPLEMAYCDQEDRWRFLLVELHGAGFRYSWQKT